VLQFFSWAYANGDKMAADLDYVPMPDTVVKLVEGVWSKEIKDGAGKSIWSGGNAN
jgi:phosphate transport system substrate-binding protein